MKQLVFLALVAAAGWYGWEHKDMLLHAQRGHEAVIRNETDTPIVAMRLKVGPKKWARERIDPHSEVTVPFDAEGNSDFRLEWRWEGSDTSPSWDGGFFQQGPIPTRHRFRIDDGGGVVWTQEALPIRS